jgi:DNA-binding transcriptional LysR family regulator
MEMHQIRYFLAVCETFNFTRAAERCNVSQPALTRGIKALEGEFAGPLFNRERNQTNLTELGRLMLPYLQGIWQNQEDAQARAKGFSKLDDAPLRLGVMCTIGPSRLLPVMQAFRGRHPGVELTLLDAAGSVLQERMIAGELDAAIYALPEGIDERLQPRTLFTERFMIIVAPGHEFEMRNSVRAADLDGQSYLARAGCEYGPFMSRVLETRGVKIARIYRSERDDWVQSMVLAGFGYGFFPEYSVGLPGLVVRPLVEPAIERDVNLVTVRGRPHTPALAAFVKEVAAHRFAPSRL